jgi:hypothetical protein
MENTPGRPRLADDPKRTVPTFIVTTFAISSVFWYLISTTPAVASNATLLLAYTIATMFCPAAGAVITCLLYWQDMRNFGFGWGSTPLHFLDRLHGGRPLDDRRPEDRVRKLSPDEEQGKIRISPCNNPRDACLPASCATPRARPVNPPCNDIRAGGSPAFPG